MINLNNMKDKNIGETLAAILDDQEWWNGKHNPVEFFAEAVSRTRNEGVTGVSIKDIAKCFKAQFDEAELSALIHELNQK